MKNDKRKKLEEEKNPVAHEITVTFTKRTGFPFMWEPIGTITGKKTKKTYRIGRSIANDALYVFPEDSSNGFYVLPMTSISGAWAAKIAEIEDAKD